MSKQTAALAGSPHILGPKPLWGHKGFKLPNYLEAVSKGLESAGHSESESIEIAVGVLRRWAAGGGKVSTEVRTASAQAIAEFEKLRVEAAADKPSRKQKLRTALVKGK